MGGAFRVPVQTQIHGQVIKTKYVKDLAMSSDAMGNSNYNTDKILLQKVLPGYQLSRQKIGETYCHELGHHIFDHMGLEAIRDDETKVELFGQILFQALDSMKYSGAK